jgi:hypothetical protein
MGTERDVQCLAVKIREPQARLQCFPTERGSSRAGKTWLPGYPVFIYMKIELNTNK